MHIGEDHKTIYLIFATMSSIPISMQASDDFSYKFPLESVFLNKTMELEK